MAIGWPSTAFVGTRIPTFNFSGRQLRFFPRRCAEAEPLFQRALAIREQALGPEHPDVATGLENYAALLRQTEREDKAEEMVARAKAIRMKHE